MLKQQRHSSNQSQQTHILQESSLRRKKEGFGGLMRRISSQLPVLPPDHPLKGISNLIAIIATIIIFLSFSISISFHVPINDIAPLYLVFIAYVLLVVNAIVILNTGLLRLGTAVIDRHEILTVYMQNHFSSDFTGFLSILVIFILDNNSSDVMAKS